MADLRESKFWVSLLKKVLKILFKNAGIRTGPVTHHQHVVPHKDGWAVKGEGNERYTAVYDYQDEAIERAKDIASNYKADVIIHRTDGTIRDRHSYD